MLVSDKHRFIFVHITKTAGTSIESVLRKGSLFSKSYVCATEARDFVGEDKWNSYFKFAFVRNPWDKVASLYRYRKEIGRIPSKWSFKDFVLNIDSKKVKKGYGRRHNYYTKNQLDCCVDESGKIILDFIGRFEKLNDDWKVVCDAINVQKPLRHVKSSKSKKTKIHYRDYYDEEAKRIISDRFSKDIEYFGYIF